MSVFDLQSFTYSYQYIGLYDIHEKVDVVRTLRRNPRPISEYDTWLVDYTIDYTLRSNKEVVHEQHTSFCSHFEANNCYIFASDFNGKNWNRFGSEWRNISLVEQIAL
jgi:hypothetical protein